MEYQETIPAKGMRRRGVTRDQLKKALEVPDDDIYVGLCTVRPIGLTRGGLPLYDAREALAALQSRYAMLAKSNREEYRRTQKEQYYDRACKYRARRYACEVLMASLPEEGSEECGEEL